MTGMIEVTGTERERRERQRDVKTGEERSTMKRIKREREIKLEIVQMECRRKEEQINITCTTEYGQRLCHSQRQ